MGATAPGSLGADCYRAVTRPRPRRNPAPASPAPSPLLFLVTGSMGRQFLAPHRIAYRIGQLVGEALDLGRIPTFDHHP